MNRSDWFGRVTSLAWILAFSTAVPLDAQDPKAAPTEKSAPERPATPAPTTTTDEKPITASAVKGQIDRGANWLIDHQRKDGTGSFGTFTSLRKSLMKWTSCSPYSSLPLSFQPWNQTRPASSYPSFGS